MHAARYSLTCYGVELMQNRLWKGSMSLLRLVAEVD